MDTRIRAATRADVPLVTALIGELADYERLAAEVVATEADIEHALFGPRPYAEAVLAERGGAAAGFARYFHTFSTFARRPGIHLEDLFVLPSHRGRGCGRALLAHVARTALARGCARLEWAVLDWNEPARRLYRTLGAREMDGWITERLDGDALERLAREALRAGDGAR